MSYESQREIPSIAFLGSRHLASKTRRVYDGQTANILGSTARTTLYEGDNVYDERLPVYQEMPVQASMMLDYANIPIPSSHFGQEKGNTQDLLQDHQTPGPASWIQPNVTQLDFPQSISDPDSRFSLEDALPRWHSTKPASNFQIGMEPIGASRFEEPYGEVSMNSIDWDLTKLSNQFSRPNQTFDNRDSVFEQHGSDPSSLLTDQTMSLGSAAGQVYTGQCEGFQNDSVTHDRGNNSIQLSRSIWASLAELDSQLQSANKRQLAAVAESHIPSLTETDDVEFSY